MSSSAAQPQAHQRQVEQQRTPSAWIARRVPRGSVSPACAWSAAKVGISFTCAKTVANEMIRNVSTREVRSTFMAVFGITAVPEKVGNRRKCLAIGAGRDPRTGTAAPLRAHRLSRQAFSPAVHFTITRDSGTASGLDLAPPTAVFSPHRFLKRLFFDYS